MGKRLICAEDFTLSAGKGKSTDHVKGGPAPACDEATTKKLIRSGQLVAAPDGQAPVHADENPNTKKERK
jgi:hypothetical protein